MTDNAALPVLDFILECYWKIQERAEDGLSFQHHPCHQTKNLCMHKGERNVTIKGEHVYKYFDVL